MRSMVVAGPDRVNSALRTECGGGAPSFDAGTARSLAQDPLFAPIAGLLTSFAPERFGDLGRLNAMACEVEPRPHAHSGHPIRFVPPDGTRLGYEPRIHATGDVITRPDNWHDLFNALVWLRFPHAKAALNGLHVEELGEARRASGRGPLRDAATQFDE